MTEVIDRIRNDFDYAVIDTPPIALVTDAHLITKYSDTNIFVIRQNYSKKEMFNIINDSASKISSSSSIIINDIRELKVLGYYYGYGYNYGYGYGYGYNYGKVYNSNYFDEEDTN